MRGLACMRGLVFALAVFSVPSILTAEAPSYSAASLVNSADNQAGRLAPNTIATLYGKNLAYETKTLSGNSPVGGDATVNIGGFAATLYYISPTQINFLIPPNLLPGTFNFVIVTDSLQGPTIPIQLASTAPALFQLDQQNIIATSAAGSLITPTASAQPGDVVVLYATGLGQTVPPVGYGETPSSAAPLAMLSDFQVLLDGNPVDPGNIAYAGVAPGFSGLYQINLFLPTTTGSNPEIRIAIGTAVSIAGLHIPVGQ
jgi:uncharacterized protein (TIGR03437 family)